MRTIGILGGMSWESTAVYYSRLNELVQERLGGSSSASLLLHSFNFGEIEQLQHEERWGELADILGAAASGLRDAGAEILLIATNTMHLLASRIERTSGLDIIHIAEATGQAVTEGGYERVLLLGTRFTMEREFYRERITETSGSNVVIPDEEERKIVHRIIYEELVRGIISDNSRESVAGIINRSASDGAQAVVLGCTELPLLIKPEAVSLPVLDTTEIHVRAAIDAALD